MVQPIVRHFDTFAPYELPRCFIVLCEKTQYSLVGGYMLLRLTFCHHFFLPEDRGRKFPFNIGIHVGDQVASYCEGCKLKLRRHLNLRSQVQQISSIISKFVFWQVTFLLSLCRETENPMSGSRAERAVSRQKVYFNLTWHPHDGVWERYSRWWIWRSFKCRMWRSDGRRGCFSCCWVRFWFFVVCQNRPSLSNRSISVTLRIWSFTLAVVAAFYPPCIYSIFSTCDTTLSSCFSQTYSLFDASSTAIAFRFQPQADKRKMKDSMEGFCQENTCREIQTFSHTSVQNLCVGWITSKCSSCNFILIAFK